MSKASHAHKNRRQLFISAARYGVLTVLGFFVGSSLAKRRRQIKEGNCIGNTPGQSGCRRCSELRNCPLPTAISARTVLFKQKDE